MSIVGNNHIFTIKFSYLLLNRRAYKYTETFLLFEKYLLKTQIKHTKRKEFKASDILSDVNIVKVKLF